MRSYVSQVGDRPVLQHGLRFCYEPQGIPLHKDHPIEWRYSRYIRDNDYFKEAHIASSANSTAISKTKA